MKQFLTKPIKSIPQSLLIPLLNFCLVFILIAAVAFSLILVIDATSVPFSDKRNISRS